MAKEIVVYGHSRCFQVRTTRAFLEKWAIPHRYVDIREDPEAAEFVRQTNRGFESVPTLVFPDGDTLTEPCQVKLKEKLEHYGMIVPPSKLRGFFKSLKDRLDR